MFVMAILMDASALSVLYSMRFGHFVFTETFGKSQEHNECRYHLDDNYQGTKPEECPNE